MSTFGDLVQGAGNAVEGITHAANEVAQTVGLGAVSKPVTNAIDSAVDKVEDTYNPVSSQAYPALGFDPAPGTPAAVSALAESLTTVSTSLAQADDAIRRMAQSDGFWQGQGADAFHGKLGELPRYLDQATESLGAAGRTLHGWSADLTSMRSTAQTYERDAEAAIRAVNAATTNPDLGLANQVFHDQVSLDNAQQRLNTAVGAINRAQGELRTIIDDAKRLHNQHQDLAEQVAHALRTATDEAPDAPGILSRIEDGLKSLEDGIDALKNKVAEWLENHAELIQTIADYASDAAGVLAIAATITAFIPVLDVIVTPALTGLAMAASAVALGGHAAAKAGGANTSWTHISLDAVGVVPFGKIASTAIKSGAKGTEAIRALPGEVADGLTKAAKKAENLVTGGVTGGSLTTPYISNGLGLQHTAPLYDDLRDIAESAHDRVASVRA